MRNKIVLALLLCAANAVSGFADDLHFSGWLDWGGLEVAVQGNRAALNGNVKVAGLVTDGLNPALKNSTVTLEIHNAVNSVFSQNRMIKITVNKEDRLIHPLNVSVLIEREYVPSSYTRIEFPLPSDFDGKLGFVFYQADLRGLQITATYR